MEEQVNVQLNEEANNYKQYILAYRNGEIRVGELENWIDKIEKKETPKEEKESLKQQVAEFVYNRLYERYIEPFLILSKINYDEDLKKKVEKEFNIPEAGISNFNLRLGFSIMANMCLLIETLQAFYDGEDGYFSKDAQVQDKDALSKAFKTFLTTHINKAHITEKEAIEFYKNIRNGILHQGETKKGWRINNGDKAIDVNAKLIDAKKFLKVMLEALKTYTDELKNDEELIKKCVKKLNAIIKNCKIEPIQ